MSINIKVTTPSGRKLTMAVDYLPPGPCSYWQPPDSPEIQEVLWALEDGDDERELSSAEIDALMQGDEFYEAALKAAEEENNRLEVEAWAESMHGDHASALRSAGMGDDDF